MASAIAILLVGISFITVPLSAGFVTMKCQNSTGHSGQPSMLDCVVNILVKPQYDNIVKILKVFWNKDGNPVLTFDGGIYPENERFQFADTNWRTSKNISLLVKDTKVSDKGNYLCTVKTSGGIIKGVARLDVKEFVAVECQSSTGHSGQPSKLDCVVKILVKPQNDLKITKVYWNKDGNPVLTFHGGIYPENERFQFADTNWTTSKNISLLVKDTKVSDEGIYSCTVATNRGITEGDARLDVKARYSQPEITSKDIEEDRVDLTCVSSGGNPSGAIHWFDRLDANWTHSTETTATQEEDKSFKLQSRFLSADPLHAPYRCVVLNSEWKAEGEGTILGTHLNRQTPIKTETTSIVAGAVVTCGLIVGLLATLLFFRRRSQLLNLPPPYEEVDQDLVVLDSPQDLVSSADETLNASFDVAHG